MSRFWLKMIGTHEIRCLPDYHENYVDSRQPMNNFQPDDWVILYAVGRGKRLFAHARVTSAAHDSGNPDWPHRVNISYDQGFPLNVDDGVAIDDLLVQKHLGAIQHGASYIELDWLEYGQAVAELRRKSPNGNHPSH
jgi:hypothetical protein